MRFSKCIYIAISALLFNACSSKIEGEAFLVTKGGDSKKLGLVEVQAYKIDDIEGFKKTLLAEYSQFIDKIAEDYKFVGLKEKHDERKQLIAEIKEANKKYIKSSFCGIKYCDVILPKELRADFQRRESSIEIGTSAIILDKAVDLDKKFGLTYLAGRVAEHTKSLEAVKTKTDADGKFSMTLSSGEYLIAAVGSRNLLAEDYFWLLRTNKSGTIRLANDSMFDQGCDTCLFSKDDMVKLNEKKKKVLVKFLNANNGAMMVYTAEAFGTGIDSFFWTYMCGGGQTPKDGPVFDWAECVN